MKKELSPVATAALIAIALIVVLGLGWKLFLAGPEENVMASEPPPPANLGPPGFQGMEAERSAIRHQAQTGAQPK